MNSFKIVTSSEECLSHHGRLGQKWGTHNGPPYPLDRETIKAAYGRGKKIASKSLETSKNQKRSPARTTTEEGQHIVDTINGAKNKKQNEIDRNSDRERAKKMSDAELKREIERLSLEQRYRDLKSKDAETGKSHVNDILTGVSTTLSVATSAILILEALQKLKRG